MENRNFRRERDSLGEELIPQNAYWGIHSLRARDNFPISQKVPSSLIKAYFAVKWACARANTEIGLLEENTGNAILKACEEGMQGKFDEEIIVPILHLFYYLVKNISRFSIFNGIYEQHNQNN